MAVFTSTALRLNYLNELKNIALSTFISDKCAIALDKIGDLGEGIKIGANLALTYGLVKNIFWLNSELFRECCCDMLQVQFNVPRHTAYPLLETLSIELADGQDPAAKDRLFIDYATTLALLSSWDRSFQADQGFGDALFRAIDAHSNPDRESTSSHEVHSHLAILINDARNSLGGTADAQDLGLRLLGHILTIHKADPSKGLIPVLMEVLFELSLTGSCKMEQMQKSMEHPACSDFADSINMRDLLETLTRAEIVKSFDGGKTWQPLPLCHQITMPMALHALKHRDIGPLATIPVEWQAAMIRQGHRPALSHNVVDFLITTKPLHKCVAEAALEYAANIGGLAYAANAAIQAVKTTESMWTKRTIFEAVKDLGSTIQLPITDEILANIGDFHSHALTASALSAAMRHTQVPIT